MAFDWTNTFAMVGELIQSTNVYLAWYSSIDTRQSQTIGDYVTAGRYDLVADLPSKHEGFKNSVLSMVNTTVGMATSVLTHRDLVIANLPLGGSTDLNSVLSALHAQMITDSKSVTANTVTISSVTATVANATAGTALVNGVLDGYNAPGNGMMKIPSYNGLTSELSYGDTVTLKCITDSESGNVSEGSEVFQWLGSTPHNTQFGWLSTGSGTRGTISVANSYTYFANLEFESFTSNAPASWTIVSGTAGTHIFAESSSVKRGTYAFKITGDGAQATIQLTQALASGQSLIPKRRYLVTAWVKGTSSTGAGQLDIYFTGTGYTASSGEKITMDSTALSAATSYTLKSAYINMPAEIPDGLLLNIKVSGTLTSGKNVYIDGMTFSPVTYENGVNVAIIAGATKFLAGDTLVFTLSNNDNGVLQTWFRKAYGVQLVSSGSPNIADSLAT